MDANYDAFQYSYSHLHPFFDPLPGQYEQDSGFFNPIYLALNRPLYLPETGIKTPFMREETGRLHYGSVLDDSLADFCAGEGFVEIRLPWGLIGFMDPSSRQVMGELFSGTEIRPVPTDGVCLGVARADTREPTVKKTERQTPLCLFTVCRERVKCGLAPPEADEARTEMGSGGKCQEKHRPVRLFSPQPGGAAGSGPFSASAMVSTQSSQALLHGCILYLEHVGAFVI